MTVEARVLARREVHIGYADTDAAGIIYFAAWFPWMERMHTEWLDGHGIRFPELMGRCGASVVSRATACEYTAVVRPYDRIEIAMAVGEARPRTYRLDYTMTRPADGATVARASLTLVGIGPDGRAAPLPAPIDDLIHPIEPIHPFHPTDPTDPAEAPR